MSNDDDASLNSILNEGIVALHPQRVDSPMVAAPTTAAAFNVLGLDLISVACLSLTDLVFQFDSSFVTTDAVKVLHKLKPLRTKCQDAQGQLPPLSVFGHADPTGDDEYNKQLSGRRAKSVYGLLTHNVNVWDDLYKHPFGGDDWSKKDVTATMSAATGMPTNTARSTLMDAYMKLLCPDSVSAADFIAQGADSFGKADYQGCSDFNPLLLLSKDDQETLPTEERNARNRSNRRVVVYLFRPGTKVAASSWPCPRADQASAGCRKRFFSDGDQRRTPGDVQREHTNKAGTADDTFACRFYSRIAVTSPCERPVPTHNIRIRLFDPFTVKISESPYRITVGQQVFKTNADADGFVNLQTADIPEDCLVEWGNQDEDSQAYDYSLKIYLQMENLEEEEEAKRRLHNLGYIGEESLTENVKAFQNDYGMSPTGVPADVLPTLRTWHNDPTQIQPRPDHSADQA